jgi:hypothetical protein
MRFRTLRFIPCGLARSIPPTGGLDRSFVR